MRAKSRIAVLLLLGPSAAAAQVVTSVRIPISLTRGFDPGGTCPVETRPAGADTLGVDTLKLTIQDDRNRPAGSPATLAVTIPGILAGTITKDSAAVAFASARRGTLPGKTLTITRDSVLVCAVTVPAVAEASVRRDYRVGIGANFDLLDGLSASDLHYDVTAFLPTALGRFGVDAGMYSGRTTSRRDTLVVQRPRTFQIPRPARDSVVQIRQMLTQRRTVSYDKLGLFLAPTVALADHLWFTLHSEVIKREAAVTVKYEVTSADTTVVPDTSSILRPIPPAGAVAGDTTITRTTTEYESFLGFGLIMDYGEGDISFRAKPMLGWGAIDGGWQSFYVVQFRVSDFKNGFKLGGEVRGRLNLENPTVLVYLAKDFGFKRLADFLVGGDDGS